MLEQVLDLDDRIWHYVLIVIGICFGSLIKATIEWIGQKELKFLRKLFRRKHKLAGE